MLDIHTSGCQSFSLFQTQNEELSLAMIPVRACGIFIYCPLLHTRLVTGSPASELLLSSHCKFNFGNMYSFQGLNQITALLNTSALFLRQQYMRSTLGAMNRSGRWPCLKQSSVFPLYRVSPPPVSRLSLRFGC